MESFFGSMQIELLDRRWATRPELAAIFEWIEAFYNPTTTLLARLPQPCGLRTHSQATSAAA